MKRPPTILHIITTLASGGAEAVLYRLITADRRHTHHVVSLMDDGRYGPLLAQAGVTVDTLGMPKGRLTVRGVRRLWQLLRQSDADVVQTWMYHADLFGGVMARLAGKRTVVWGLHHMYISKARTRFIASTCGRLSCIVPRRIISCSRAAVRIHADLGYAEDRMVVIPNGYDLAQFRRDETAREMYRTEWDIPPGTIVFGLVARWDPAKDHANLAEAVQRACAAADGGCRLVLVGPGIDPGNTALAELLARHDLQGSTLLLGSRYDIPQIMSAIDVHVLSSVTEGFPNVVAEAMACGTPCVATDAGDAALIIGDTGWVVPVRNPVALASALTVAMDSVHQTTQWASRQCAARQRIQTMFSIEAMVRDYSEVWRDATSS